MENLFENSACLTKDQMKGYLQKQMNKSKQLEVERHLIDCALCSDAIDGYTNHYNFESDQTFENLDGFLKEKEQMMMTKKTVQLQPRRSARLNRIAASILFFLIPISGFVYWNATAGDRLFDDLHSTAVNISQTTRGGSTTAAPSDETLASAEKFYRAKDFEASAHLYTEYLKSAPEDASINFYAGNSFLEINQPKKAIEQLSIARLNSASYYEEATWYMVLANLKLEDFEEAKILANELLNMKSKSRFEEKLKVILEELE